METAPAFLNMIDPAAFEIALNAATPDAGDIHEYEEPIPACRHCGGLVGTFLSHGLGPCPDCVTKSLRRIASQDEIRPENTGTFGRQATNS
jgi:hypothetical protein